MKTKIILTETRLEKKEGFKNAYRVVETETKEITEQQHKNITDKDTQKFFRRLGGSERGIFGYTCLGYKVIRLISYSPNRVIKVIREFTFED